MNTTIHPCDYVRTETKNKNPLQLKGDKTYGYAY